ncbi:MAG: NRDE family protein [Desulfamplus sp.]|nr:NRDE family protein [Desulfamplus sp.]
MCLIVFGYGVHEKYRLVLAANRDEFFDRPTAPLDVWEDHPEIIGGRDLKQKGTWLAFSKKGRFAALTNVRNPGAMKYNVPSRGDLATDFLLSGRDPLHCLKTIKKHIGDYNGFNLLAGNLKYLFFLSTTDERIVRIKEGIHAVSNHTLDTPWVKVEMAKQGLRACLGKNSTDPNITDPDSTVPDGVKLESDLYEMMRNREIAPDEKLPCTGVGVELERLLSPLFVSMPGYGTRSTSIVLLDYDGKLSFSETTWSEKLDAKGYRKIEQDLSTSFI